MSTNFSKKYSGGLVFGPAIVGLVLAILPVVKGQDRHPSNESRSSSSSSSSSKSSESRSSKGSDSSSSKSNSSNSSSGNKSGGSGGSGSSRGNNGNGSGRSGGGGTGTSNRSGKAGETGETRANGSRSDLKARDTSQREARTRESSKDELPLTTGDKSRGRLDGGRGSADKRSGDVARDRRKDRDRDGDGNRGGHHGHEGRDKNRERDEKCRREFERGHQRYHTRTYESVNYNNYQYGANAYEQGYSDGLYTGASDAYRGRTYDPERSHFYKNAAGGFRSVFGNQSSYRQAYRDGFLRGYEEGYQHYQMYFSGGSFHR